MYATTMGHNLSPAEGKLSKLSVSVGAELAGLLLAECQRNGLGVISVVVATATDRNQLDWGI